MNPAPLASCAAGDVSTGGTAFRDLAGFPTQDITAFPMPGPPAAATGWTTGQFSISEGSTVTVVALCAALTP